MRILLDENLPKRLKQALPSDWEIASVAECGWSGKRNGELIRLAEQEYDCFVTMDRGIEFQQNLSAYRIAVVVIRAESNRYADLVPLIPVLAKTVPGAAQGSVSVVRLA